MDLRSLPAVAPAAGILTAASLALGASWLPVPLLVALLALGLAAGRSPGRFVAGLAVGALAVAVQAPEAGEGWGTIDPQRPVSVEGRVSHPWWRSDWGWRGEIEVRRWRQGRRVVSAAARLRVELAGEETPPAGSRIRARGYIGRSSGFANRLPVGPGRWRLRIKTPRHLDIVAPPGWTARTSDRLRARVESAYARLATAGPERPGRPGPAMARALVLGDPSDLPPAWRRGLRRSGLAHLLAVSGLHAALVAGLALALTAPLPRSLRVAAAALAVLVYLALVGPRPSLLRATAMALLAGSAWFARRAASGRNALAVAAGALTLEHPRWLADVGFQLTLAATAGIVFLAPWIERAAGVATASGEPGGGRSGRRPERRPGRQLRRSAGRWLGRSLAATVAAQAASLPFAVPAFHQVSWEAPALNLVAVPYAAVTLAVSLAWTALAVLFPPAAGRMKPLLDAVAAPFGWPAAGPPSWWGTVPVAGPAGVLGLWLAAASSILAVRVARRPPGGAVRGATAAALLAVGAVAIVALRPSEAAVPEDGGTAGGPVALTLLDVGQGDAVLLQDGARSLLVDGGGWRHGDFGGRVLLPALLGQGVRRLDAVVSTHGDADHCRGLVDVASYLTIRRVWLGPDWQSAPCEAELARVPGAGVSVLSRGGRRRVGRWRLSVLYPPASEPGPGRSGRAPARRNQGSLVLLAEAAGRRVLLTGDLYRAGERRMLRGWGMPLSIDVLKVGHHGSKTSTGPRLLAATAPRLALVSAGRGNPYGHPAAEVVARLEGAGARVLSTIDHGQITLHWRRGGPLRIELPAAPP